MIKKKLTPKQAQFLNCILDGDTQINAYKKVYSTKNSSEQTIKINANQLFKHETIQMYYKEALKELTQKSLYTREQAINDLKLVINAGKQDLKEKGLKYTNILAITKSIEQLSSLLFISEVDNKKLELETDKLELAKSKLQKDNNNLQKENASLLRDLVSNARTN